jgi:hypothetical protein
MAKPNKKGTTASFTDTDRRLSLEEHCAVYVWLNVITEHQRQLTLTHWQAVYGDKFTERVIALRSYAPKLRARSERRGGGGEVPAHYTHKRPLEVMEIIEVEPELCD